MRLGHGIGMVEKEDGDLLVRLLTNVDTAVNKVRRLVPTSLPWAHREPVARPVAVLDRESIATQDHRYSMKWVTVPVHRLAGREPQPADANRSTLEEFLLRHLITVPSLTEDSCRCSVPINW